MCTVLVLVLALSANLMFLSVLELYMQLKRVRTLKKEFPQSVLMPKNCSVPGCKILEAIRKSVKVSISFYKLPTDADKKGHQWLISIYMKKPITISPYTCICSLHFKNRTSYNDIPTLFPWAPIPLRKSPVVCPFIPPTLQAKKPKDDNSSKQLQSYADQIINQVKRRLHLEPQLKTITEELEWMSWLR